MKIVKVIYTREIKGELKKVPSYFLYVEGGQAPILIKPVFNHDYKILEFVSEFGGFKDNVKQNEQTKK